MKRWQHAFWTACFVYNDTWHAGREDKEVADADGDGESDISPGIKTWFTNIWHWVDIMNYILFIIFIVIRVSLITMIVNKDNLVQGTRPAWGKEALPEKFSGEHGTLLSMLCDACNVWTSNFKWQFRQMSTWCRSSMVLLSMLLKGCGFFATSFWSDLKLPSPVSLNTRDIMLFILKFCLVKCLLLFLSNVHQITDIKKII